MLLETFPQLEAKLSVDIVSFTSVKEGDKEAMSEVTQEPPIESASSLVRIESL